MNDSMHLVLPLSTAVAMAILTAGCSGSGSDPTPPPASSAPPPPVIVVVAEDTFPTGIAVGSPADLSASAVLADAAKDSGSMRFVADVGRAVWSAIKEHNAAHLANLAGKAIPISTAHAAASRTPELAADIATVERVLSGDSTADLGELLDFDHLFRAATNAPCYGPSMKYSDHQDAAVSAANSGTLPGGDLGIWLEYDGAQPCVAAQLSRRVRSVKGQTQQGLMLMAAMRRSVMTSGSLIMPVAGATTDLTTEFEAMLRGHARFAAFDVGVATIARDATADIYTYRLTLANGLSAADAKSGEVILIHTPGSSSSVFTGVMQVAAFALGSDGPMGCSDAKDASTGLFQTANVSTLKYSRADLAVAFSSRAGNYCGHPESFSASAFGAAVASYTAGGELDPAVAVTGGIRGTTKGWVDRKSVV